MELRHLKYFIKVSEELNFRRAAEKLFIVQPALSRQIKQLEEELGVELFKRTKRSVKLTEAGKYFVKEINSLFYQLEQSKKTIKLIDSGLMGKIKISYVGSAMHSILPSIISKIQQDLPDLHTELSELTSTDQLNGIRVGNIDVGFFRNPFPNDDIETKIVFEETYSIVLPQNHPIDENNFKGLRDLANENFILLPRSAGEKYYDNLILLCNKSGFTPKITHESVYGSTVIRLVENNLGVSIVPSSLMKGFNAKVKFIELKNISDRAQLIMGWNKNNNNPARLIFLKTVNAFLNTKINSF